MAGEHQATEHHHRHERPEDWGWHAEMGRGARIGAVVCAVLLVLLVFSTHGSRWELVWAVGFALSLLAIVFWDYFRRKNAWRS